MGLFLNRLFGLGASVVCGWLIYYNWQQLLREGTYSFRIAGLAPMFALMGLYIMIFPKT